GGTLSALACLRLRDDPAAPELQVLAYANTDLAARLPSMVDKGQGGFGLEEKTVRFFARTWQPDETRLADPDVSPLRAASLAGLPAAIVVCAEHDPLRDEGLAYARRLHRDGVPVVTRTEAGLVHNFLLLDEMSPACARAGDRLAADVRTFFSEPGG
ncbi:MAG TPA: alpha/beta hydrolase fold domain-containing protein, partial [Myxococcota bacterium]